METYQSGRNFQCFIVELVSKSCMEAFLNSKDWSPEFLLEIQVTDVLLFAEFSKKWNRLQKTEENTGASSTI